VRRLLIAVVLLVLLLSAVDVGTRITMQHQLELRVDSYEPNAAAKVTIFGFPFLLKLALNGRVDKITAHARQVSQGPFVLDRVDVKVSGVRVLRSRLLHQRQLEIVSIDSGTVTVDMTEADFARLVGLPVTLGAGTAQVMVGGVLVTGHVSISNGHLELESAGLPVSVPIPALPVLPCLAQVRIVPGHLIGSCTFHQIPAAFKVALQ
jgi:hypothetical protein